MTQKYLKLTDEEYDLYQTSGGEQGIECEGYLLTPTSLAAIEAMRMPIKLTFDGYRTHATNPIANEMLDKVLAIIRAQGEVK